ncbi:hypothetical protein PVAP13_6KG195824 [Panicum virgatum]|uniref:Uncharacterized protein n=1 Tax=Panicum virgatum TaxID=38727 RepID=A0A8T0RCE8_PANVG|nr:hypothetical protein PVAP13_6KG195824 [Panicum virgatum]
MRVQCREHQHRRRGGSHEGPPQSGSQAHPCLQPVPAIDLHQSSGSAVEAVKHLRGTISD